MLIDFSLTKAAKTDLHAGTVGYLDPFLADRPDRHWDLHAERYWPGRSNASAWRMSVRWRGCQRACRSAVWAPLTSLHLLAEYVMGIAAARLMRGSGSHSRRIAGRSHLIEMTESLVAGDLHALSRIGERRDRIDVPLHTSIRDDGITVAGVTVDDLYTMALTGAAS